MDRFGSKALGTGSILGSLLLLLCLLSQGPRVHAQENLVTSDTYPTRFLAAHGRRALLQGNAAAGLEGWVYPLQVFTGLSPSFRVEGAASAMDGRLLLRRVEYSPTYVERTYIGPDFTVHERLFVPAELPGAVLTYTIDCAHPVAVVLQFKPVFDLMWPVSFGGQEVHWRDVEKAYRMDEPTGRFFAMVGSPDAVLHDDLPNTSAPLRTDSSLRLVLGPAREVRLLFASDSSGWKETEKVYDTLLRHGDDLAQEAVAAQEKRRAAATLVQTPDAEVNQALAWSQTALDQAWVTNPTLGSGLVAGYGPSRGLARRPQYDWFFADDALVSLPALLLGGEVERARDALLFLFKYQDPQNGMMWHELSQSASYVNWVRDYPYMFPHVDTTFRFLVGLAQYAKVSGDTAMLREHWAAIAQAYRFCTSLLDSADGLPRVPAGKEGHDEQGHPREELQLALDWKQAAEAYAAMATAAGFPELAEPARSAARRAAIVIPDHFWNAKTAFWNTGLDAQGQNIGQMRMPSPEALNLLDPTRRDEVIERTAGAAFETPWGARSVASDSRSFDPNSYAQGSVWAASTAEAAETLWAGGQGGEAWKVWRTLLPWLRLDSLGHVHETVSGSRFEPQIESVPEQTWSSALLFSSFVEGLAGVTPDGREKRLVVAPQMPEDWAFLKLQRVKVGHASVDLQIARVEGGLRLEASATGDAVCVTFRPPAPAGRRLVGSRGEGQPQRASDRQTAGLGCSLNLAGDGARHAVTVHFKLLEARAGHE